MTKYFKRNCNSCGEEYYGQGRYYCSYRCEMIFRNKTNNPSWKESWQKRQSLMMLGNKFGVASYQGEEIRRHGKNVKIYRLLKSGRFLRLPSKDSNELRSRGLIN